MKYRHFELLEDINQGQYIAYRLEIQRLKPPYWEAVEHMPIDLFYDVLTRAAVIAGWVQDVVEKDEYEVENTWGWSIEYIDNLPAGTNKLNEWGEIVLQRWVEIRDIDPN